jgi:hypothetical protein
LIGAALTVICTLLGPGCQRTTPRSPHTTKKPSKTDAGTATSPKRNDANAASPKHNTTTATSSQTKAKTAQRTDWGFAFNPQKSGPDRKHFAHWKKRLFDTRKGKFDAKISRPHLKKLQNRWKKAKTDWVRGVGMDDARQKMWRCHRFIAAAYLLDSGFFKKTTVFLINFSKWTHDWNEPKGAYQAEPCMHTSRLVDDPVVVAPTGRLVPTPLDRDTFNRLIAAESISLGDRRCAAQLAFLFVNLAAWRAPIIHRPAAFAKRIRNFTKQAPKSITAPHARKTAGAKGQKKEFMVTLYTFGGPRFTSLGGLHRWELKISPCGKITRLKRTKLP